MFSSVVRAAPLRATSRLMAPKLKPQPSVGIFTPETAPNLIGSAAGWGAAGVGFIFLYMSGIPRFDRDVAEKLPFVRVISSFHPFSLLGSASGQLLSAALLCGLRGTTSCIATATCCTRTVWRTPFAHSSIGLLVLATNLC